MKNRTICALHDQRM